MALKSFSKPSITRYDIIGAMIRMSPLLLLVMLLRGKIYFLQDAPMCVRAYITSSYFGFRKDTLMVIEAGKIGRLVGLKSLFSLPLRASKEFSMEEE